MHHAVERHVSLCWRKWEVFLALEKKMSAQTKCLYKKGC